MPLTRIDEPARDNGAAHRNDDGSNGSSYVNATNRGAVNVPERVGYNFLARLAVKVTDQLESLGKPVIAAINGLALMAAASPSKVSKTLSRKPMSAPAEKALSLRIGQRELLVQALSRVAEMLVDQLPETEPLIQLPNQDQHRRALGIGRPFLSGS